MADEQTTEAEIGAIVAELVAAGLLTIGNDAEGKETWTLTREGARVGRMLAMKGDGAGEVLAALLDRARRAGA
jgi:hypothetical protein